MDAGSVKIIFEQEKFVGSAGCFHQKILISQYIALFP